MYYCRCFFLDAPLKTIYETNAYDLEAVDGFVRLLFVNCMLMLVKSLLNFAQFSPTLLPPWFLNECAY